MLRQALLNNENYIIICSQLYAAVG
jgi:hypothetical protein